MSAERPPRPAILVAADDPYVLGFPAYVALTLSADPPDAGLSVRGVSLYSTAGVLGIQLFHAGGAEPIHERSPSALFDREVDARIEIAPGESRRMICDLAELFPPGLAAGAYSATILYGELFARGESARFSFSLDEPSAAQRGALDAIRTELKRHGSWGEWAMMPLDPGEKAELPSRQDDPLRYARTVRYFLHGPEELREIDPALLSVLGGFYAPEAEALRAELYAARDPAAFKVQAELVRERYPALSYWMSRIERQHSRFGWARKNR
jgi:hypothetical protein